VFGFFNTWEKERESKLLRGKVNMDAKNEVRITWDGKQYVFNGLGLANIREKTIPALLKSVKEALKGMTEEIAIAKKAIAGLQIEITWKEKEYVFNGLGLQDIRDKNLACLERSVERALAGLSDKMAIAQKAIDDYRSKL
jgi:hypothetical protein